MANSMSRRPTSTDSRHIGHGSPAEPVAGGTVPPPPEGTGGEGGASGELSKCPAPLVAAFEVGRGLSRVRFFVQQV